MIYKWKLPGVIPVDAQIAGSELDRICKKNGGLRPADVVDESRPEEAPLHGCFEWDDRLAAEQYRQTQAQFIIRSITTEVKTLSREPIEVRAFFRTETTGYQPIEVVMQTQSETEALLSAALGELRAFRRKYETLSQLSEVFRAIDQISA